VRTIGIDGTALLLAAAVSLWAASARADDGATTYVLDPNSTIQCSELVETDQPAIFSGMVVNNYLGANTFYENGITGQNTITANVEAGYIWGGPSGQESLQQVTTYVKNGNALGQFDRHATWVGMIIGGRNGGTVQGDWQTGVAPGTTLESGALASSWSGSAYSTSFNMSTSSFLNTYKAFFGTADVINSSYGYTDSGGMNTWTLATDGFAAANPQTTFVVAAGNSGSGSTSVGGPGSGYNGITVGALASNGTSNTYTTVASFSSGGPQNYYDPVNGTVSGVRAAVDLVAPGQDLVSAYYDGQTGGNGLTLAGSTTAIPAGADNYYSPGLAGTSFAAPIVAGGVALLDSASRVNNLSAASRDSLVIKAVLMNSADKLAGWNNGQTTVNGVITTTQSLDWSMGAGAVDLNRAYGQYLSGTTGVSGGTGGTVGPVGWDLGLLGSVGSYNDYVFNAPLEGGSMFDVTLDWFRNTSVNVSGLTASDLGFANLDLQVWNSTFTTLLATSDSIYNNVQELHFSLPQDGDYGLRIEYAGQVFGTATPENYGLAWSGTAESLVSPVPEPTSLALLSAAAGTSLLFRRRRPRGG
jgi:hypothetical protein